MSVVSKVFCINEGQGAVFPSLKVTKAPQKLSVQYDPPVSSVLIHGNMVNCIDILIMCAGDRNILESFVRMEVNVLHFI